MGWLRVRVEELGMKPGSDREVARRMLKSRHWRQEEGLNHLATLAIYLGRLDKTGGVEWLDSRPAARRALADVLELAPEDLEEHLKSGAHEPARITEVRLTLWDLDAPFDLRREPLPPGIPAEAMDPRTWPRWWQAPSGSGRSLVGRWLEARGLATVITAETWAEAEQRLPARGAVFVELTHSAQTAPPPVEPPANLAICIASDESPPRPPLDPEMEFPFHTPPPISGWSLAEPEPLQSWLGSLVYWAAGRLPGESAFNPEECLHWLQATPLKLGLIDGFGAALGFIGLFAEFGGRRSARVKRPLDQATDLAGLARLFLRMRLRRIELLDAEVQRDDLWKGLLRLARGLLMRSARDWRAPRTLDEWYSLADARPDAMDLHWVESLRTRGSLGPKAAEELKRAASELPPNVFRTVQVLKELKMLRAEASQHFTLRPRWFLAALVETTGNHLLDEGPSAWGTALLHQHGAAIVLEHLVARCHRGDYTPIQALLAAPEPRRPEWVAALEGALRALGITLIEGGEVPESLRLEVLHQQLPLLVERWDDHPVPRVGYEPAWSTRWPLLARGTWYLAAFALAETLAPQLPASASRVAPWRGDMSPECLQNLLREITHVGLDPDGLAKHRQLGALELGGRLLHGLGPIRTTTEPISWLQLPEWLLQQFQAGRLAWEHLRDELHVQQVLRLMPEYVERRGASWDAMARVIWKVWLDALGPESKEMPQLFWPEQPWTPALWGALPIEAITPLITLFPGVLTNRRTAFNYFQPEHWRVLFRSRAQTGNLMDHLFRTASFWRRVPSDILREALTNGVFTAYDHEPRNQLWLRIPAEVPQDISLLIDEGRWREAIDLAWSPPEAQSAEVIHRVAAGLSRQDVPRALLVAWAYESVARRAPGWEQAWEVLERLTAA
ncbi:hypothetical protein D7X30_26245 [Corallococcus sp. AB011P]|uniref:hypothetical protein n=1 Tax=Corallococcus sp. AB011P TaxID=2316735 RepID=UPI000EA0B9A8|nr:hypothetical protein [Corallococcus sp. AB011P]RKG55344.1 hypothetical protein D7X30_26245 [Corallococcus sp. AB011P]